ASTTYVVCEVEAAGGEIGIGYTAGDAVCARLIEGTLAEVVYGGDAIAPQRIQAALFAATRNSGRPGIVALSVSAIDLAVWDLKAKLVGLPLVELLGSMKESIPVYGSGGLTSYSTEQLTSELGGWVGQGIPRVKMKVGRDPVADRERVAAAREAIGPEAELYVDANGAYSRKQALAQAERCAEQGVSWLEEPVPSDDLDGLRAIRERVPAPIEVTAGEYGFSPTYFARMIDARAVDVLQADVTRCGGITDFLRIDALCRGRGLPLSTHCAPAASLHVACATRELRHIEWFVDHIRCERILFDGLIEPRDGQLHPDRSRPGHGIELKKSDLDQHLVFAGRKEDG
ncbi:MAG: enolase C-terminal domain-like protein, partial [Solirubrobacterales bacterium]